MEETNWINAIMELEILEEKLKLNVKDNDSNKN